MHSDCFVTLAARLEVEPERCQLGEPKTRPGPGNQEKDTSSSPLGAWHGVCCALGFAMTFSACSSHAKRLLAAFAFAFLCTTFLCGAKSAFAQSITVVNSTSLPRLDKNGNSISKRDLTLTPEAVNLQDCLDDQKIRFTLQLSGFEANASIQAWAATSGECKDPVARSTVKTCWQLGGGIPLQTTVDVDLRVREIMSGVPSPTTPKDSADLCGTVDLSTINVHFLYFPPGQTTASVDQNIQVIADTVGPAPPTGLTALPGNTRVQVSWANISGEGGLSELTGVKVYCDPATPTTTTTTTTTDGSCTEVPNEASTSDATDDSGDATTIDAGTTTVCSDASTSTTPTTTTKDCASPNFILSDGGKIFPSADFNSKYECGNITGNSGTTAVATSVGGSTLSNGTRYAIAVAATDKYGNVGPLSEVVCETPEVTTDFWDDYKKAGGKAGGGCSTTATNEGLPLGSLTVFGIATLITISTVTKRRRSRASTTKQNSKRTSP